MNSLYYQKRLSRNIGDKFFTSLSVICVLIAILPLIFLVTYILYKGGSQITPELFTLEPNPPGDDLDAGGINPALIGTLIITTIASIIAIPVGVGGGIYLAEYSKGGAFSRFIKFKFSRNILFFKKPEKNNLYKLFDNITFRSFYILIIRSFPILPHVLGSYIIASSKIKKKVILINTFLGSFFYYFFLYLIIGNV